MTHMFRTAFTQKPTHVSLLEMFPVTEQTVTDFIFQKRKSALNYGQLEVAEKTNLSVVQSCLSCVKFQFKSQLIASCT